MRRAVKEMAMSDYEIRKGVPIPSSKTGRNAKYPWHQMEVGDSFVFNGEARERAQTAASQAGRRYNKKFSVRKTEEGIVCWRTA